MVGAVQSGVALVGGPTCLVASALLFGLYRAMCFALLAEMNMQVFGHSRFGRATGVMKAATAPLQLAPWAAAALHSSGAMGYDALHAALLGLALLGVLVPIPSRGAGAAEVFGELYV